jgi:hypothetical protein
VNFSGSDLELLLGTGRNTSGALLSGDYFSGQLAEMLVYNDQLSIGQINLVANYLSSEYGLPFAYETNLGPSIDGDHNADGTVDAADYVAWRKTNTGDQQGYDDWRANFGNGFGSGGVGQVPEPGGWMMLGIALLAVGLRRFHFGWHMQFSQRPCDG